MAAHYHTPLTAERLREELRYDPETGKVEWLIRKPGRRQDRIGCVRPDGYVAIGINRKQYLLHRLIFLYMTGEWPKLEPDHFNRNRADNRWVNLRDVTHPENAQNHGVRADSKSGVTGINWHERDRKWGVFKNGKYFGQFTSKDDAIARLKSLD